MAEKYRTRRELTPELIDVFCKALELPATFTAAANVAGFSERTMRSWLAAGESEDCTDEVLQLLASRYAKTMTAPSGVRSRLMRTAIDLAEGGNEKMLQFCLKALIPQIEPATNVKIDATVTPVAPKMDLTKLTTEQLQILKAAENIRALASGD